MVLSMRSTGSSIETRLPLMYDFCAHSSIYWNAINFLL